MAKKLVDTGGLCIYQFVGARRRQMIGIQVGSREVTMTVRDFAAVLHQAAQSLGLQSTAEPPRSIPDLARPRSGLEPAEL